MKHSSPWQRRRGDWYGLVSLVVVVGYFVVAALHSTTTASLVVRGTEIRWTRNNHDRDIPAHTAPRSQRYWDKHKIPRPDYAKTDAEIAAERGLPSQSWGTGGALLIPLLVIFVGSFAIIRYRFIGSLYTGTGQHPLGNSLGSSNSESSSVFALGQRPILSTEEIRLARMARFDSDSAALNHKNR